MLNVMDDIEQHKRAHIRRGVPIVQYMMKLYSTKRESTWTQEVKEVWAEDLGRLASISSEEIVKNELKARYRDKPQFLPEIKAISMVIHSRLDPSKQTLSPAITGDNEPWLQRVERERKKSGFTAEILQAHAYELEGMFGLVHGWYAERVFEITEAKDWQTLAKLLWHFDSQDRSWLLWVAYARHKQESWATVEFARDRIRTWFRYWSDLLNNRIDYLKWLPWIRQTALEIGRGR